MRPVLVVGSVALDTLETPFGRRVDVLGGSAVHFALAASRFAPVRLVGVVGRDFPEKHVRMLRSNKIDTSGLERVDGRTFRWHGRFEGDMSRAQTLSIELNVFATFQPRVPAAFASSPFVLLGNSSPATQSAVLDQLRAPRFVMLDTMDFWISSQRPALLRLLKRVHALCVNFEEAKQLAGAANGAQAIRKLLNFGVKTLIMKRGEHGATLATRRFQVTVPAFATERVVDPTGAGDSFAGGVLGYLSKHGAGDASLRRALVYGAVIGSFTVEKFGAERMQGVGLPEIEARARRLLATMRV